MARKLTTIFAADIAQYSQHVEDDEIATLAHLANLRQSMDAIIRAHEGSIANTAGDSVIAVFDSAVEAVLAAIEIQAAHKHYNETVPVAQRLKYRIGIHIGDVTVQQNGDVLGGGVNIAARLESIAQPGGICLSESVFEQVDRKLPTDLKRIGEHYVKNLSKPIRVYAISDSEEGLLALSRRKTISFIRKPAFLATLAVLTVVALGASVYVLTQQRTPEWAQRAYKKDESVQGKSEKEILAKFDLVTQGHLSQSRYLVIRTWGASMTALLDLAAGLKGHLVTITSPEENQFVYDLTLSEPGYWVVQDVGGQPQSSGPMIGLMQDDGAAEPANGWHWVDGEPLSFTAWAPYQPGNSGGHQNYAQFRADGREPKPTWDDIDPAQDSVVIEIEATQIGQRAKR
ncbi:adenylate/guanylate cyclase domain-containing protein [Rhizobium leguminosarum]